MKYMLLMIVTVIMIFSNSSADSLDRPINQDSGAVLGNMQIFYNSYYFYPVFTRAIFTNGIEVYVKNTDTGKKYGAFTRKGYFAIVNLAPGKYEIFGWRLVRQYSTLVGVTPGFEFTIEPGTVFSLPNIRNELRFSGENRMDNRITSTAGNSNDQINYFKQLDNNGFWSSLKMDSMPADSMSQVSSTAHVFLDEENIYPYEDKIPVY